MVNLQQHKAQAALLELNRLLMLEHTLEAVAAGAAVQWRIDGKWCTPSEPVSFAGDPDNYRADPDDPITARVGSACVQAEVGEIRTSGSGLLEQLRALPEGQRIAVYYYDCCLHDVLFVDHNSDSVAWFEKSGAAPTKFCISAAHLTAFALLP